MSVNMKFSILILFLSTSTFQMCYGTICPYQRVIENSKSENKVLRGHIYTATSVSSLFHCIDLCMKDPRCRSFNILGTRNIPERSCQLNDASREDSSLKDLTEQQNSTFYNLNSTRISKVLFMFSTLRE